MLVMEITLYDLSRVIDLLFMTVLDFFEAPQGFDIVVIGLFENRFLL